MKAIIWGHKLHSHTHSYVHNAFHRAFQHMGYETSWFDDSDDVSGFDFSDSIFITEGQVCKNMPIIKGSKYVLHNCYDEIMWEKIKKEKISYLKLQTYTDDVLKYNADKIAEGIYFDVDMLYIMWATDLLPDEIILDETPRTDISWWVGTMGEGKFGNMNELNGFKKACEENDIQFCHANNLSIEENRAKIRESYLAPAIVGTWQKEKGYVPCRIFKNISYGQIGLTNSKATKIVLGDHVIYTPNEYELFSLGKEAIMASDYKEKLIAAMNFIKENHTYINRINTILKFI
jgi:hypothetical protein